MIYKTIDLCAGIGGIRRGFELTGHFQNVISAEVDEPACKTYEHLFGDNPRNDLTSDEFKRKIKEYPLDPPIKIEAQKPAKLLLEKRDKRYEDD